MSTIHLTCLQCRVLKFLSWITLSTSCSLKNPHWDKTQRQLVCSHSFLILVVLRFEDRDLPLDMLNMFPDFCSPSFFLSLDLTKMFRVAMPSLDIPGISRNKSPPASVTNNWDYRHAPQPHVSFCAWMLQWINKLWLMHAIRTILCFKNKEIFSTCNKRMRFK